MLIDALTPTLPQLIGHNFMNSKSCLFIVLISSAFTQGYSMSNKKA